MDNIMNKLNELYNYEYFGLYLIIAIIILAILFVIILFFGKKDQRKREVEATKKLEIINNDAFNESINTEPVVNNELENTVVVPNLSEINEVSENEFMDNSIQVESESENELPVMEEVINEPILEKNEEKPFSFEEEPVISEPLNNEISINEEIDKKEEISVPEFNFEDIVNIAENSEEINKEIETQEPVLEKNEEIKIEPEINVEPEIPQIKEEVHYENVINNGPQVFSSVYAPERKVENVVEEEEDFELPQLKTEEPKIQEPVMEEEVKEENNQPGNVPFTAVNEIKLDDLTGETYNLNK